MTTQTRLLSTRTPGSNTATFMGVCGRVQARCIHRASVAVVYFASRLLLTDLLLPDTSAFGVRLSMYREWLADMDTFEKGSWLELRFALDTICAAVKLNVMFRKANKRELETGDPRSLLRNQSSKVCGSLENEEGIC